ncbi:MAG: hypothetical protein KF688_07240 [Pirellulales bacterium]|nr:hypothetical protein [Pirellulales bacterium]
MPPDSLSLDDQPDAAAAPASNSAALAALAAATTWSYRPGQPSAAEPAAWTAISLAGHGRIDAAANAADWLARLQQKSGAVGVSAEDDEPRWCTALAMLAWLAVDALGRSPRYAAAIERAATWALQDRGKTAARDPNVGHDTMLVGWSWAADTHSWLEPTCLFVLALCAAGHGDHPRVREGLRLVADRLLSEGGANFGNTTVLGQTLLPHLEPSGLAAFTLAAANTSSSPDESPPIERTLSYLDAEVQQAQSPVSLAYALLGLTAWERRPANAEQLIDAALAVGAASVAGGPSIHALALTSLARLPAAERFAELCRDRAKNGKSKPTAAVDAREELKAAS